MEKVVITGVNGFLGNHLSAYLSKNYTIIGVVREGTKQSTQNKFVNSFYESSDKSLENLFSTHKIFSVIHLATLYSAEGGFNKLISSNIALPMKLLELSEQYGIKQFINTDTFFSDHLYSYLKNYTISKKMAWLGLQALRNTVSLVNLKLFHVYGPFDKSSKFVNQIFNSLNSNSDSIDFTNATQKRDFIYVEDVCTAFETVLNSNNKLPVIKSIDVGTGYSTSIKDFVQIMKEMLTSKTKLNFGVLPSREGEIADSKAEVSLLTELGWSPKYTIKEGIQSMIILKS